VEADLMARVGNGPVYSEMGGRIPIGRFTGTTVDKDGIRFHAEVWPAVMRLLGITSATLPGHDPPVAWPVSRYDLFDTAGIDLMAHTGAPIGGVWMGSGDTSDFIVLPEEPGPR
jgi:hypothetical protein